MVGVDLVYVPRVRRILGEPYGGRFLDRMLSEAEKAYIASAEPGDVPVAAAGLFAAKEAVIKASGTTFADLRRVRVELDGGRPRSARIEGEERAYRLSTTSFQEYVIAIAVSER